MAPRFGTVTVGERDFTAVARTREAAQKVAARRARQRDRRSLRESAR